ncbi:MAG: hypothetical protein ABH840_03430 [Nanoarchaeota archaeon]
MTLITKLEDSEEGLMGTTKQGEKVHLGTPVPYSAVHSLRTDDYDTARKRKYEEAKTFEEMLDNNKEGYVYFDKDNSICVCGHTEDIPLRRWFSDGKFVRNYSVKLTYLQFDGKKEEAFRRQGQEGYSSERGYGGGYVRIHRVE